MIPSPGNPNEYISKNSTNSSSQPNVAISHWWTRLDLRNSGMRFRIPHLGLATTLQGILHWILERSKRYTLQHTAKDNNIQPYSEIFLPRLLKNMQETSEGDAWNIQNRTLGTSVCWQPGSSKCLLWRWSSLKINLPVSNLRYSSKQPLHLRTGLLVSSSKFTCIYIYINYDMFFFLQVKQINPKDYHIPSCNFTPFANWQIQKIFW